MAGIVLGGCERFNEIPPRPHREAVPDPAAALRRQSSRATPRRSAGSLSDHSAADGLRPLRGLGPSTELSAGMRVSHRALRSSYPVGSGCPSVYLTISAIIAELLLSSNSATALSASTWATIR